MLEKMTMTSDEQLNENPLQKATTKQQDASDPKYSVWVEASAGTGKTKVLTDRVLRLLLNGVHPSKILCLTYTKAAAVNMKERIAKSLAEWAVIDEEELAKELFKVSGKLPEKDDEKKELFSTARRLFAEYLDVSGGMKIQTIHSFCQDVLKRFPLEAKISPYFEVMDERKSAEILNRIKKEILEDKTDENTKEAVSYLVKKVTEGSFPKILKGITEKRTKFENLLKKYNNFSNYKNALAASLSLSPDDSEEKIKKEFYEKTDMKLVVKIYDALTHGGKKDKTKSEKILAFMEKRKNGFEMYMAAYPLKKDSDEAPQLCYGDAIKYWPELQEKMEEEWKRVQKTREKLLSLEVYLSTLYSAYIAGNLVEKYNEYKRFSSKTDYDDLIITTKNLLSNEDVAAWVMYKLDGGIEHILIDEAQDNSPYQWDIVRELSVEFFAGKGQSEKNRTVFAVGDRKQSIYGFQGADPDKFEEMKNHFSKEAKNNFKEVNLDVSFRSAPAVLSVVDAVFKEEKNKDGLVPLTQEVKHSARYADWFGEVELWEVEETEKRKKDEKEDYDFSEPTASSKLAKKLAAKIKETVEKGTYLASKSRFAKYSDFMILVQRRKMPFLPEFMHECRNLGIPLAGADRIKLLEQIAVQDLISLGKFLLLPTDDLSLAEVLKSPLFGLNDDDLIKLCCERGGASLWSRLSDFSEYGKVYAGLQELLSKTDYQRPFELYNYVLSKSGGRKKFLERMGGEVEEGLDEFLNLAINFEQEHIPTLQNFIQWIEADDVEIKREMEQSENEGVRVLTAHSSKGLQAPIVVLPETVRKAPNKKELKILEDDFLYFPLSSSAYGKKCCEINEKLRQKEMKEYRRLLYVAMTRAEDRLCICGFKTQNSSINDSWYEACENAMKKIGKAADKSFVYEEGEIIKEEKKAEEKSRILSSLPNVKWINSPAESEAPLSRPYRPSLDSNEDITAMSPLSGADEFRYKRGTLIHKILQFVAQIAPENLREKVKNFLQKNAPEFSEKYVEQILCEIETLLENKDFSAIFGKDARAEVAIMGEVDGKIVSAQIDRLLVEKDRVVIVDFKTNRPAAESEKEIPQLYKNQLMSYKKLLQKIYPDKSVETYILWTNTARLMRIE